MQNSRIVRSSPHLHSGDSTRMIMLDVIIALLPASVASIWLFGWQSAALIVTCIAACLASEYLSRLVLRREQTVGDLSAVVTGLLLALNLPATLPLWQAALGSAVAIVVVKQMFGGLGHNFVNPALVGRIVLMVSFPAAMNQYVVPFWMSSVDGVATATPLVQLESFDLQTLFFGTYGGAIGETCAAALLLGGVYLVVRRVIQPTIPVVFIGTVFVLSWLISGDAYEATRQILSGGLMLGAIFMATDYVTCPVTTLGKVIYALGCGGLTVLIRQGGSLPEGVSFAIVVMNILVPLIERVTYATPFGKKGGERHA
ncbi:MAG: RnfABCDGE type electron transport complex subunit D [Clostridia bacterium]|nr:RnfABCDGE type electron transport complex subunit D [Clostridia bacterium]